MTGKVDIVNLALQAFGSKTTLTEAQLTANGSNEAKQANLAFNNCRDSLIRMAPWDCVLKTANLAYITSVPGTPENSSVAPNLWQPGMPRPPWAYEYQYPVDCLRACWMIPSIQTGLASGAPITTAVTGAGPNTWLGGPIGFKIATDNFWMVTDADVVAAGSGYVPGEIITLNTQPPTVAINNGLGGTFAIDAPQGAPAQLLVSSVDISGGVTSAIGVSTIIDDDSSLAGSYFFINADTATQNYASADGTGATFDLTFTANHIQRVILTNQQYATLVYCQRVEDPNIWDPLFQDAMLNKLAADICKALTGNKDFANLLISEANTAIMEARKVDGNEGLTINDVTPDFLRVRGIAWTDGMYSGPGAGFDWGGLLPTY